jgi:regulator of cell morphogenesis and NO signaling
MITPQSTLRSIALAQPATIRVFEHYNLDYCCGGNRPLAQVCAEKNLALDDVLAALTASTTAPASSIDPTILTPTQLIHHIVSTHHAYVRAELPRLIPMAERVGAKHGASSPELAALEPQLNQLSDELIFHLNKEERILFPYIESLDAFTSGQGPAPHSCFATVESPIQAMIHEHEAAGALLAQMRAATNNFTPPPGACPTLVGLMDGIDAFERDLHRHVHLENNLLFPKAIELEKAATAAPVPAA